MAAARLDQFLRAQVKVLRKDVNENVIMEANGFAADGKTLLRQATKIVTIAKGDPLPEDLAEGEQERLERIWREHLGEVEAVQADAAPGLEKVAAEEPSGGTAAAELNLDALGAATDEELVAGLSPGSKVPGVKKLLEAVAAVEDIDARKALAARLLKAEKTAQKGDARKSLVEGLEKVAAEEPS